jgi:hypothetical protein
MGVAVDKAGPHHGLAQIPDRGARGRGLAGWQNGGNATVLDFQIGRD